MKDDLVGELEKYRDVPGGLQYVSVHIVHDTCVSRGLWPPPRWSSTSRDLVVTTA